MPPDGGTGGAQDAEVPAGRTGGGPSPGRTGGAPRPGRPGDLDALEALQHAAYDPPRRSARRSLARSLRSATQAVWVVDDGPAGAGKGGPRLAAAMILWLHPRAVRIYDLAVHPDRQGRGLGAGLLRLAEDEARRRGARRVLLEADTGRPRLAVWYEAQGYRCTGVRRDFYGPGRDAWRYERDLAAGATPAGTAPRP